MLWLMDYIFQMPLSYDDKDVSAWPNLKINQTIFYSICDL